MVGFRGQKSVEEKITVRSLTSLVLCILVLAARGWVLEEPQIHDSRTSTDCRSKKTKQAGGDGMKRAEL